MARRISTNSAAFRRRVAMVATTSFVATSLLTGAGNLNTATFTPATAQA